MGGEFNKLQSNVVDVVDSFGRSDMYFMDIKNKFKGMRRIILNRVKRY